MSPANPDDRRYVRVQTQLWDAVKEMSATRPAESIPVAELAQTADVSRAVFYHHATSPAALLATALIDDLRPAFDQLAQEMKAPGAKYVDVWRRVYLSLLDHVVRHEGIYRVMSAEESSVSSALESYFEQAAATYVAAVSSHLDDDPPTALWQAMAIAQTARDMTAVIRAWVRTNLADPPDRVVDTYFTLAPPWQLARADETGRITLRRGRGHRDLPPRADQPRD